MFAALGDLSTHPFGASAASQALARGALTFEAEDFASDRYDSLQRDTAASGGAVRRIAEGPRARPQSALLVYGVTSELPTGDYRARFKIAKRCGGFRGEELGAIELHAGRTELATHALDCGGGDAVAAGEAAYPTVELAFRLPRSSSLRIDVRHDQGMLALDAIDIVRAARGGGPRPLSSQAGVHDRASDDLRTARR
jgi:hypothetical protein